MTACLASRRVPDHRSATRRLLEAGVDERLYEDMAFGRRVDRPGLVACLKSLRAGDTPVVWKLDRLGRDLRRLVNTVHSLNHVRVPGRGRPPVGGAWSRRKGAGHVADLLDEAKGVPGMRLK